MPPGQALGIALVIVLAVIGGLYLVWRSHTTGSYLRIVIGASRDSENDVQFLLWRNLVAGCVFGIGCLIYGGALGMLGAALCAWWSLFHFWVFKRVRRETADHPQQA